MDPCKAKGRDGPRGSNGKKLKDRPGILEERKGCECKFCFLSIDEDEPNLAYVMRINRGEATFPKRKEEAALGRGEQIAIPCGGSFKTASSPGTAAYRRTQSKIGKKKKFPGCTEIEEKLARKKFICHRMQEEGANPEAFGYGPIVTEGRCTNVVEFFNSLKHQDYLNNYLQDSNSSFVASKERIEIATSLGGILGLPPEDIRESTLRHLFESKAIRNIDLELTAKIILELGEVDAQTIKEFIPNYKPEDFPSLQAKVYKFVEQRQHPALQKFDPFWASLTARQRKALRLCHMQTDAMSVAKAAKHLNLSFDSMRDRLSGAMKKLVEYFPEYAHLIRRKNKAKSGTDLSHKGMFRKSTADLPGRLWRIDPGTGARTEIPIPSARLKKKKVSGEHAQKK
jgi:hypothetical protein